MPSLLECLHDSRERSHELEKNSFIDKLIQAGTELPDQKLPVICEVYVNQPGGAAKFHCEVCAQNMCEQCCKVHGKIKMSESHEVTTLFDENMNIDVSETCMSTCDPHGREMRFYCNDCDKVVCSKCLSDQHKRHQSSDVKVVAKELRKNIQCNCESIDLLLENAEKQLRNSKEMLKEFLKTAETAEQDIIKIGNAIRQEVDKNVSLLLDNVRVHKLEIQENFEKEFQQIQKNKNVFEGYRNYCRQIIKNADIYDLLFVKEDIRIRVCGLLKEIGKTVETLLAIDFIPSDCPINKDEDRMKNPQQNIIGSIRGEYS